MELVTVPGDLILDSFAGSGTTGHAVLELNKQDGGNRRFLLVEMEEPIATGVTAARLQRVITGYNKGGAPDKPVRGLGGGFRFCRLGTALFDEFGDICTDVTCADLAAHIFFAETGMPIPARATGATPLLGTHRDRAVYLLFTPEQEERPGNTPGTVLTPDALATLPAPPEGFTGTKVIYAGGTAIPADRLRSQNIIFKQIPYQIEGA